MVIGWFRASGRDAADDEDDPSGSAGDESDSPQELMARQWEMVQYINRNAGRLPTETVVLARGVTDTVRSVIASADDRDLDVYAIVSINGILSDYLPTTLRSYLALDPSLVDRPQASGRTPRAALDEQVEALSRAAGELLEATRSHDVDAIFTQGSFLRTKFGRSDLDL